MVLNVDIAPSLLAAGGIAAPTTMQGRDYGPLVAGIPVPGWRHDFFYEHAIIKAKDFIPSSQALVVAGGMKYIRWPDFSVEELFDVHADPHEEHDLIADPAQMATLATLRARFSALQAAAR
jgi:arylsulfatase A-like enzyme